MTDRDLADRVALRDLVERYAAGADRRDPDLFASCFTGDGVLVTPRGALRGQAELREVPARLARYRATAHLVGGQQVHLDGDEASGEVLCTAHHLRGGAGDGGERVLVMHIRYHDRYRRGEQGWQIAKRSLEVLWEEDHPTSP